MQLNTVTDCNEVTKPEIVIKTFKRREQINAFLRRSNVQNGGDSKFRSEGSGDLIDTGLEFVGQTPNNTIPTGQKTNLVTQSEYISFLQDEGFIALDKYEENFDFTLKLRRLSDRFDSECNQIYKCLFKLYFDLFQRRMMAYAKKKSFAELINGFDECTDEGFQEGYLAFYQELIKPKTFDFSGNNIAFKDYFLLFCSNHCRKIATRKFRARKKDFFLNKTLSSEVEKDWEELMYKEFVYSTRQYRLTEAIVKVLNPLECKLIKLKYFDGLKPREIAEKINMDRDEITRKLYKAHKKMKKYVEKNERITA